MFLNDTTLSMQPCSTENLCSRLIPSFGILFPSAWPIAMLNDGTLGWKTLRLMMERMNVLTTCPTVRQLH
ncbi:hypothetical protein LB507_006487 [Fusarium sp. FIESC RH6]|nr:hypothetical protein LB507_006487 [Fusarium sp. FIESC RH6]